MENTQLSAELFAALAANDAQRVGELCHADLSAIQNGGPAMTLRHLIGFTASVMQVVTEFRYENAVRGATPSGFVEEHDVCCTLPDDSTMRLKVCVVADVRDGKISALREYFDSAAAAGMVAALS